MSELAKALAAVQAKLPVVPKGKTAKVKLKTGGEYSYRYADLSDVSQVVLPLLGAEGLAWVNRPTLDETGRFVLIYKLTHTSGEFEEGVYPLPDPSQHGPQEIGSALTYARRYALCSVVGVAPDEDDDAQIAKEVRTPNARQKKTFAESTQDAAKEPEPTFSALQLEVKRQLEGLPGDRRQAMRAWWEGRDGMPAPNQLSQLTEQQSNDVLDQIGLLADSPPPEIPPGEDPT